MTVSPVGDSTDNKFVLHVIRTLYSGCVTSAETVLIQQQSYESFLKEIKNINSPDSMETIVIVAISPNSLASISE